MAAHTSHAKPRRPRGAPRRPAGTQLLAFGSGYGSANGSAAVRAVQLRLARAGDAPGPIDGRYGPLTEQAVVRFQATDGLQVDGIAGPRTLAALSALASVLGPGDGYQPGTSGPVRALQLRLARAGYGPGPIDGRYGPLTERAVSRYQAGHSLQVDGVAGSRTLASLHSQVRSPHGAHRGSQRLRSRPHATHHRSRPRSPSAQSHPVQRRQAHRPAPRSVRRATDSGASPWLLALVLVVGALGLGVLLAVIWRTRRRGSLVASPQPQAGRDARGSLGHQGAVRVPFDRDPGVEDARASTQRADGPNPGLAALLHNAQFWQLTVAEAAYRRADQRGDANGAFNLGVLLEQRGDLAGAHSAYRRADQRGHAAAACNLGVLLEEQGDLAGAEAAYRRADGAGDTNGAFNLGVLLEQRGDLGSAQTAYRRADHRGHAAAACNLGVLLEERGEVSAAEAAYRRADHSGDANGAFNLGVLLEQRGDLAAARTAYRRAGQRGSPEVASRARAALSDLRAGNDGVGAYGNGGGHDGA